MEVWNMIIGVAEGAVVLLTLLGLCIKPLRSWLFGIQDKKDKELKKDKERDEALKALLRNTITQFYYARCDVCELRQYEFENISKVYKAYKDMGGNSFVDKLWEEIQLWTIIP